MNWKIAQAKKSFSDVLKKSRKEPQIIYNRDTVVAAIINPENLKEYLDFKDQSQNDSLATAFMELQTICTEENYVLLAPKRNSREVLWP
jgi:hypothetical protein